MTYVIANAFEELERLADNNTTFDFVCLDDAWQRPKRSGGFGVEYPTHTIYKTFKMVNLAKSVLNEGGWLIMDCDDWILSPAINYICETWGNAAEDYKSGFRKTGRVVYMSNETVHQTAAGMYLSNSGYPVIFAHKGETDRRTKKPASQLADKQRKYYDWGSVKPQEPYYEWLEGLSRENDSVCIPCAGTAPAALASERLGLDYYAIDCEEQAKRSFEKRKEDELAEIEI